MMGLHVVYPSFRAYQGPLEPNHPDYKGTAYNMLVESENGEKTYVRLSELAADDPVSCDEYEKNMDGLTNQDGQDSQHLPRLQETHQSHQI